LSAYVAKLNVQAEALRERQNAQREEAAASATEVARERLTPLEDRLSRLLATIPAELQREGLSLPALQAALRGRWRGKAHPGEIGIALRRLGFVRVRQWSGEEGFQALWRNQT